MVIAWIFFQLNENHMRPGTADVLSAVSLRGQPQGHPGRQLYVPISVSGMKTPMEIAKGVHDTVWMLVGRGLLTGFIDVFQDPHTIVFKYH